MGPSIPDSVPNFNSIGSVVAENKTFNLGHTHTQIKQVVPPLNMEGKATLS